MSDDSISRQAAITAVLELDVSNRVSWKDAVIDTLDALPPAQPRQTCEYWDSESNFCALCRPSAQPDRDIPVKPVETTDNAWGIPSRQAVCPKCDYYLGHVAFLGDYKGKRITYCETCGQAIDWEGWEFDE